MTFKSDFWDVDMNQKTNALECLSVRVRPHGALYEYQVPRHTVCGVMGKETKQLVPQRLLMDGMQVKPEVKGKSLAR